MKHLFIISSFMFALGAVAQERALNPEPYQNLECATQNFRVDAEGVHKPVGAPRPFTGDFIVKKTSTGYETRIGVPDPTTVALVQKLASFKYSSAQAKAIGERASRRFTTPSRAEADVDTFIHKDGVLVGSKLSREQSRLGFSRFQQMRTTVEQHKLRLNGKTVIISEERIAPNRVKKEYVPFSQTSCTLRSIADARDLESFLSPRTLRLNDFDGIIPSNQTQRFLDAREKRKAK